LLEVGAVCFRLDGRELATFQTLINPEVPIPPDVQQVQGINDGLAQGQLTIEHVLPLFIGSLALPTRCSWPMMHDSISAAIAEPCAITIVYDRGSQQPHPRMITPRVLLEVYGVAYMSAHCHMSDAERTFRLDRIRECWLD
jgi:WYL domain